MNRSRRKARRGTSTRRRRQCHRAARTHRTARVEQLEDRRLLATTRLIIDFTPDNIDGEYGVNEIGDFRDAFYTFSPNDARATLLDYNGDGVAELEDADLAARDIGKAVRQFFDVFNSEDDIEVSVLTRRTDPATNNVRFGGYRELIQSSESVNTHVIFVGHSNPVDDDWGFSFSGNHDSEGRIFSRQFYSYVFSEPVADILLSDRYTTLPAAPTAEDYTDFMALTIAHEFAHQLGAGHVFAFAPPTEELEDLARAPGFDDVMNYYPNVDPKSARFLSAASPFAPSSPPIMEVFRPSGQKDFIATYSYDVLASTLASGNSLPPTTTTYKAEHESNNAGPLSATQAGFGVSEFNLLAEPVVQSPPPSSVSLTLSDGGDVASLLQAGLEQAVNRYLPSTSAQIGLGAGSRPSWTSI